jgi:chromosome segregation ATPase
LLREADAKYGWQLQKRNKEVVDVKLQAQSRIGRLVTQKKTLSSELKAVTRSKHEAVAVMCEELRELRKTTKDKINMADLSHRESLAKLEEEKSDFRQRMKGQRSEFKERVASVASRNEALERLCTVSEVESKKLGRELSSEQLKAAALRATQLLLAERVHNLATEKEELAEALETRQEADKELRTEMASMRTELAAKCAALDDVSVRFTNWKDSEREFTQKTKAKMKALRNTRDKLVKVSILSMTLRSYYFPLIMSFAFCVSSR